MWDWQTWRAINLIIGTEVRKTLFTYISGKKKYEELIFLKLKKAKCVKLCIKTTHTHLKSVI